MRQPHERAGRKGRYHWAYFAALWGAMGDVALAEHLSMPLKDVAARAIRMGLREKRPRGGHWPRHTGYIKTAENRTCQHR